jgi:Ni/Co efflux regulator RcnB
MKRVSTIALAAVAMALPLSAGVASAQTNREVRQARQEVREERRDVRDARQDLRNARHDYRQVQRWNERVHNGYTFNGRWYYGEPSRQIMAHRNYEPGYRNYRRGDRLSTYQRQHMRRVDYRRERLRTPPRGYEYVRTDRGETLLVAIATGVILSAILNAH